MPTKKQIEQLKQIQDPLTRKKYAKFLRLPQDLQTAMFDVKTSDTIWKIAQDNKLSPDQLWQFSYLVGMILLGDLHIAQFIKTIQEKCQLSYEASRSLARQVNKEIFLPVKESLKIVHKIPKWPREEQSQQPLQNRIKSEEETRTINLKK